MAIEYVKCSLCGSIVPRGETEKYGYCEVCHLLIEKEKEEE